MEKREYKSEREYVLYVPESSGTTHGFIKANAESKVLQPSICNATRMTSVEANREALDFHESDSLGRYPFKLKVCDYKNLTF